MTDAPTPFEIAARVGGAADLVDIRLLNSSTDLADLNTEGDLSFRLAVSTKVEHHEGQSFFVIRQAFRVLIDEQSSQVASVTEDSESADAQGGVATLNCEFAALYELVGLEGYEPSEGEFQAYSETSATLTLFPFAREFVSDATSRLGLPKLILPPVRVASPWHHEDVAEPG